MRMSACRIEGGGCVPVALSSDARDPSEVPATTLVQRLGAEGQFQVDARLPSDGLFQLTVDLFDAEGDPVATGTRTVVGGQEDAIALTLFPPGRGACAASLNRARAFHHALALPSGDVLITGGVTATEPLALELTPTASLAPEVEVYLASEDRFVVLKGIQFRRVGFDARVISGTEHEVRVRFFGGMTAEPGQPVLRLDADQSRDPSGAPLLLAGSTQPAEVVDLVLAFEPGGVTGAWVTPTPQAFPEATVEGARGQHGPLVGGVSEWPDDENGSPVLSGQFTWTDPSGESTTLLHDLTRPRWGAAVARFSETDATALVWGGNVTQASVLDVVAGTAEWVTEDGRALPVAPLPGVSATALSALTPLSNGALLLSGGVPVGCPVGCAQATGFGAQMADPAAHVLLRSGDELRSLPVDDPHGSYTASVFHSATSITDGDGVRLSLLTGGARLGADAQQPFEALGQVAAVWLAQPGRFVIDAPARLGANPGLITPRFGHTVTSLGGARALVVGGLASMDLGPAVVEQAELLSLEQPPQPVAPDACVGDLGD